MSDLLPILASRVVPQTGMSFYAVLLIFHCYFHTRLFRSSLAEQEAVNSARPTFYLRRY
ncbi:hypothetical protein K450DRAFT_250579 [Umbelopsis ramanniana AG]|uniref:Uncharacterized protein n=1 Tax=Umbelopsis ramanniana AG TaxID=1314678 RepID=A0AAD5E8T7_UMBRA|nr:uncharacterized protein K450DRAFT_250579 [Umbelopsis ramanniana AG]KAI8577735.1 hypothetical protein K450DRAFT_250579 [Umbelopsis ramanniana AG]